MIDGSSLITTIGVGSGVNMTQLATDLADAQFAARKQRIEQRSQALDQSISAAASIKNSLSILASSLGERVRLGDLAPAPVIRNPSIADVALTPGAHPPSDFTLEVTRLAGSQTLASPTFDSPDTIMGDGTITIRFGQTDASSFAADAERKALSISVPPGATLAQTAAAINAAGPTAPGAYIVSDATGSRLVLKGAEGEANGFVIETAPAGQSSIFGPPPYEGRLAELAWQPGSGSEIRLSTAAQDASCRIDGLDMRSASNAVGEVLPGVALTLTGTNAREPTQVSFSNPDASIGSAMQDLVGALNEIASELGSAMTPPLGALASDPAARTLRQNLSRLAGETIMPNAEEGSPRTLADLGLVTERNGGFRLDVQRLNETLARDPAGAADMFTTGFYGVYATFDKLARSASRTGNPGSFAGSVERYERQSVRLEKQGARLAERQEDLRVSMIRRFAKVDAAVGASNSTLTFLQAQIDAWNGTGNR